MRPWTAIRLCGGVAVAALGTWLLLASVVAAIAVGGIEASVGRSGIVTQPLGSLSAAGGDRAVVVDDVSVQLVPPELPPWITQSLESFGTDAATLADEAGSTVLIASPTSDTDIFLGVGNVDAVNNYLLGTPYSVAVQPDWETVSVPGDRTPADPMSVAIWSASSTGGVAELPASDLTGTTLVLMFADARPDPEAALRLEYRVPQAPRALQSAAITAAASAVGGLLIVLLGAWLIVGRRRTGQQP